MLRTILFVILIFFSVACSDSKSTRLIQSFSNDLNTSIVPTGRTLQINVFANYTDGTSINITETLIWSSSDESLATVENGLVSATDSIGDVEISYETQEKLSNGSPLNTTALSLEIKNLILKEIKLSQTTLDLFVGATKNITATATFENNTTIDITNDCSWSSSNTVVSSVLSGLVAGISEGDATIIATDSDVTSDSLEVKVTKITYTSLRIQATKTKFNVEQTIELKAIATIDSGGEIILNNNDVIWQSDKENIVRVDDSTAIATAIAKGSAVITASLKVDTTFNDTAELDVIKDVYLRLFKEDGEEIDLIEIQTHTFNNNFNKILDEFSLKAVGDTFKVSELSVKNFDDVSIRGNDIDFIDLNDGDEIRVVDGKVYFKLSYDGNEEKLKYSFKVNDAEGSIFLQNYQNEVLTP